MKSHPKLVLLVDDEPNIRLVLSAILEQAGYRVVVAEDGFMALRKIQEEKPDLVVTDLRMPNMNGFELLTVLRSRFPEIPTIAVSGEFVSEEVNAGPLADAFFQKGSYGMSEFLGKIADLLTGPLKRHIRKSSMLWSPTGDAPVMLTCTNCLRTFPVGACNGITQLKQTECIFCGSQLEVQLVAVGMVQSSGN